MRIALIDDDEDVHDIVITTLTGDEFQVYSAYDGPTGLRMVRSSHPDLVLLDILLPNMDGWDVCQAIRQFSDVPIIMISAAARDEADQVRGLDMGADDYLVKPLRPAVLKARIRAVLRRHYQHSLGKKPQVFIDPHLTIDLDREQVYAAGQRITLSHSEFSLISLLVRNLNCVVPMIEIIEELWGEANNENYAQYVRIHVSHLREYLEPDPREPRYILTEHGLGYRFCD